MFGHIVGVHSPMNVTLTVGLLIHLITAICIGIIAGLFLYKTNILNISKPSNGLRYGLLVGTAVYLVFALPVEQSDLDAQFEHTLSSPYHEESLEYQKEISFSNIHLNSMLYSIFINLLFGIILGLFSSLLTIKFGARY